MTLSNDSCLVKSNTTTAPWEYLKFLTEIDLNLSWPIDPAEEIFEKNEKKEKTDEGNEEVLSALSEESNNEKEYNNHLLAQYETVN